MLSAIIAFIGIIPGIGSVVQGITSRYFDAKVNIFAARTGVTRDVAIETIRAAVSSQQAHVAEMQTIAGSAVLVWLVVVFAVPIAAYEAKVVVWDTMFGLGSTPPIHGDVAAWMNLIINWLFGSSMALAAGSMGLKAIEKLK